MKTVEGRLGLEVGATEDGAAAAKVETEKTRRALLKGLGVAAAGAVVAGVLAPEEAEAHGTVHYDSNSTDPAIHGDNTGGGPGVQGDSTFGVGVQGGSDTGVGVIGTSDSGNGVFGGSNGFGRGVFGSSLSGSGVVGDTLNGTGTSGFSSGGTGVLAVTDNGLALDVHGPVKFSTAGNGTIPAQQNSVVVSDSAVTADSHITMTLTGNPGSVTSGIPAVVVWIQREPGAGFTARLSRRVTNATPFTYLIVEPG